MTRQKIEDEMATLVWIDGECKVSLIIARWREPYTPPEDRFSPLPHLVRELAVVTAFS